MVLERQEKNKVNLTWEEEMNKTFCDRCEKEIEGKPVKRGNADMCKPCSEKYDKFMEGEEKKGNKIGRFF